MAQWLWLMRVVNCLGGDTPCAGAEELGTSQSPHHFDSVSAPVNSDGATLGTLWNAEGNKQWRVRWSHAIVGHNTTTTTAAVMMPHPRRMHRHFKPSELILQYTDENKKMFTFASSKEMWTKYVTVSIVPLPSKWLNNEGKCWTVWDAHFPTPTKTWRGD